LLVHFAPLLACLPDWERRSTLGSNNSEVLLEYGEILRISVRTGPVDGFSVSLDQGGADLCELYSSEGPFGLRNKPNVLDSRVPYLRRYLSEHQGIGVSFDIDTERAALWMRNKAQT
jgi:hypothetical protein